MLIQFAILFCQFDANYFGAAFFVVYVSYCLRHIFINVIKVSLEVHYSERGNIEGVFLWLVHTFIN